MEAAPRLATQPRTAPVASLAAVASLATLVVSAAAIVAAAAAGPVHSKLVPVLHRLVAGWVLGPLHGIGVPTSDPVFHGELAVMGIAYVGVVALAPRLGIRPIVAAVVALQVAFALSPLLLSTDVFNYVEYAYLGGVHHLDPYVRTPASFPGGPVWAVVHWRHTRDAYGPLFTLGSYPLGSLGAPTAVWAFKAISGVASLAASGLVWWIARRLDRVPARALAAFGLNPILLVSAVGGAHNDLLMLAVLLAGVALLVASREIAGGAVMVAAIGIKATAGLAIPLVVLGYGRRRRSAIGLVLGALALAGIAYVAFPDHALGMLRVMQSEQGRLLSPVSIPLEVARTLGAMTVPVASHPFLTAGVATILLGLVVWVWRGGDAMAATAFAFVALLATSPWMLSWYSIWPLAFAAIARNRWPLVAVVVLQVAFAVGEVVLR